MTSNLFFFQSHVPTPNFMWQENAPYHVPSTDEYWKYFDEKHQKLTWTNKENISPLQEDNWL